MIDGVFCLGLTGSIGMGKSTVAAIFLDHQVPVWSADEAVERIYQPGGGGCKALQDISPETVCQKHDRVRKEALMKMLLNSDPSFMDKIEHAIHPLVRNDRQKFIANAARSGKTLVVAEVPLLFESQSHSEFDAIAVVTVSSELQKARVLSRKGMTVERFEFMMRRQMPDAEKQRRADYIICSSDMESARNDVATILSKIRNSNRCN